MGRSWSESLLVTSLGGGPGGQKFDHRHWGPAFPHSYENASWQQPSSGRGLGQAFPGSWWYTHRRKQTSRCCYGEFTRSTMQVGAAAASRLPSTLLGEVCVHRASQVESQVPILSPCACWPHSPTTEWQDLGSCLLPLVWAMHQMHFLSGRRGW